MWKNGGCLTVLFYVTLQCKLQYIRQQCCQHKTINDKDKNADQESTTLKSAFFLHAFLCLRFLTCAP